MFILGYMLLFPHNSGWHVCFFLIFIFLVFRNSTVYIVIIVVLVAFPRVRGFKGLFELRYHTIGVARLFNIPYLQEQPTLPSIDG